MFRLLLSILSPMRWSRTWNFFGVWKFEIDYSDDYPEDKNVLSFSYKNDSYEYSKHVSTTTKTEFGGVSICQYCLEYFNDGGVPGSICEDCKAADDDHRPVVGADTSLPCQACQTPTRNRDHNGPMCDDCLEDAVGGSF